MTTATATASARAGSPPCTPPPAVFLQQLLGGPAAANLVYVAAELGLADLLIDGPKMIDELASLTGALRDPLQRVLRGLIALGVLRRTDDDGIGLTPVGTCLATEAPGSLRTAARLMGHPSTQWAWSELLHTVLTGEPAFDRALGTDFGTYLGNHSEVASLFNAVMSGFTTAATPAVIAAYDFGTLTSVVDVGGGDGTLLRAILRAYPQLHGGILDLPHARARAERGIAADGLSKRCEFVESDMFVELPPGADAYLLKSLLHDWDDEHALAILTVCARAAGLTSRVLLIERLMPEAGDAPVDVVMSDLTMLAMTTGRERTETEYRALLTKAELRLQNVISTVAGVSILEVISNRSERAS